MFRFIIRGFFLISLSTTAWATQDPFLWLEKVEGKKALAWVEKQNQRSLGELTADPRYAPLAKTAEEILQDDERIPQVLHRNGYLYNFWQDKEHVRGIWRRTTMTDYKKENPSWELLLDLDKLAKDEKENWVLAAIRYQPAMICLPPQFDRCLIGLSRGGKDALVYREFDLTTKTFLDPQGKEKGFFVPEAKTDVRWLDQDRLLLGTDFGPGSLTTSGYPRTIKIWKRGTPLSNARTLFEGEEKDVVTYPISVPQKGGALFLLYRWLTFFTAEYHLLGDNEKLSKIPVPIESKFVDAHKDLLLFKLGKPWRGHGAGSLVAISTQEVGKKNVDNVSIENIYAPDKHSNIEEVVTTEKEIYVHLLRNVTSELYAFARSGKGEKIKQVAHVDLPKNGTLNIRSSITYSEAALDRSIFVLFQSFLTPPSLYLLDGPRKKPTLLKRLPPKFPSGKFRVDQLFAESRDGTKIPYFIIQSKTIKRDGQNPTLLYGYGGFEISLTPGYKSLTSKLWLEQGGIYVQANIRGGGEFGPDWHEAALKKNRQLAYDDFLAVAEDLIKRKITSPRHLGIMGGSNGGLLVGAAFTQRPALFRAVVCVVPLLDMIRYTKLPPGASWIAEYGDPEIPAMRKVIEKYSPYQNVVAKKKYPQVLFVTSTRDDRVHPGHARKMAAKMLDQGHPVLLYENTEGGHGAAANLKQKAKMYALEYVYLMQKLFP